MITFLGCACRTILRRTSRNRWCVGRIDSRRSSLVVTVSAADYPAAAAGTAVHDSRRRLAPTGPDPPSRKSRPWIDHEGVIDSNIDRHVRSAAAHEDHRACPDGLNGIGNSSGEANGGREPNPVTAPHGSTAGQRSMNQLRRPVLLRMRPWPPWDLGLSVAAVAGACRALTGRF